MERRALRRGVNRPMNRSDRIKDGRAFHKSRVSDDGRVTYLRCGTHLCCGTAKSVDNGEIIPIRGHSGHCYATENLEEMARFREDLKSLLSRNFLPLKEAYDTVAETYPREIVEQVPFASLVQTLKRWRRSEFLPNPRTPEEIAAMLERSDSPLNAEDSDTEMDVQYGDHLIVAGDSMASAVENTVAGTAERCPFANGVNEVKPAPSDRKETSKDCGPLGQEGTTSAPTQDTEAKCPLANGGNEVQSAPSGQKETPGASGPLRQDEPSSKQTRASRSRKKNLRRKKAFQAHLAAWSKSMARGPKKRDNNQHASTTCIG